MNNTNKTTKNNTNTKDAFNQIKRDIRATVARMNRPKGSYGEIATLNKTLTKQLNTYMRLSTKATKTVNVKVSL